MKCQTIFEKNKLQWGIWFNILFAKKNESDDKINLRVFSVYNFFFCECFQVNFTFVVIKILLIKIKC